MTLHRRAFLSGMVAGLAAPALVRATSLMPIRGIVMPIERDLGGFLVPPGFVRGLHRLIDAGIVLRREIIVPMHINCGLEWRGENEQPAGLLFQSKPGG